MATTDQFCLESFLASLTTQSGVYQMYDAKSKLLYVGKARNLKKRVSSYFQRQLENPRLISLVQKIHRIEVIVTRNENEALLLENQLIKQSHPRYNILLRDDKSFPYIVLTHHDYPRLMSFRGTPKSKDHYYGPYPSGLAVRETIKLMQSIFRLRTCEENFFKHRSRPCLLYQIKKCSAPCVNYINQKEYAENVTHAKLLLTGKNQQVVEILIAKMTQAAQQQHYEIAAQLRDQIAHIRHIQMQQTVITRQGDSDVWSVITQANITVVVVLTIREGRVIASQWFYPKLPLAYTLSETLAAVLPQYYLERKVPQEIIVAQAMQEAQSCVQALSELREQKIKFISAQRGKKYQWLLLANRTAQQALTSKMAAHSHYHQRLVALQNFLQLPEIPKRLECFDISHTQGEATIASCVVFDENGPLKNAYRRFNIQGIQPGDDYAALYQALARRYQSIQLGKEILPDILFIDGGKGQLHQAEKALKNFSFSPFCMVAIAKGPRRKAGEEQLFIPGQSTPLILEATSPALHIIQQIRDEAHRFALYGHQRKREKSRKTSLLENIPGVGKNRRQALLQNLGGWQEVRKATIEELQRVPGISPSLAQRIYDFLRNNVQQ